MTKREFTRRWVLSGMGSVAAAGSALASPPASSVRPRPRPGAAALIAASEPPDAAALFAGAGLTGRMTYAVADARSGELLESYSPLRPMPPASVAKAVTALYGLNRLGPGHRFRTRLVATGLVRNGRLDGDLVLIGSGDPALDTEALGEMAAGLKAAGVADVGGRFLVVRGPIPTTRAIDRGQPDHLAYNPSVAGLNLNYNRVHFEWERKGQGYDFTLEARAGRFRPSVTAARMEIVDRTAPVFDYATAEGIDRWSVARGALGSKGARWLPVRHPVAYTVDVFRTLARAHGIVLPPAQVVARAPVGGAVLYEHVSDDLHSTLREMLKFSTNLTAEVVGQTATVAGGVDPVDLPASAAEMSRWLAVTSAARAPAFVDHSGLGEASDLSPRDMVAALAAAGPESPLVRLMKPWYFRNEQGGPDRDARVRMSAKTGTLNFVSGLAGYMLPPGGRPLAFAVFIADEPRRAEIPRADRERPAGARTWGRRARRLQDQLLKRWNARFLA